MANHLDDGWQYARDIVSGKITSCETVKLSCERALADLRLSDDAPDSEWEFSDDHANHMLQFCSYIHHVKGELSGQPFSLEPWQTFLLSQIYGWRRRTNSKERRYREVLVEVGRKNGKSFICSCCR